MGTAKQFLVFIKVQSDKLGYRGGPREAPFRVPYRGSVNPTPLGGRDQVASEVVETALAFNQNSRLLHRAVMVIERKPRA